MLWSIQEKYEIQNNTSHKTLQISKKTEPDAVKMYNFSMLNKQNASSLDNFECEIKKMCKKQFIRTISVLRKKSPFLR